MKKNIAIVLLAICVIGLGVFLVYDKVLKDTESKNNTTEKETKVSAVEKINDSKDYYYYETTEVLGEFLGAREGGFGSEEEFYSWYSIYNDNKNENLIYSSGFDNNFFNNDGKIQYKYPVLNINSEDAKEINLEIEKLIRSKIRIFSADASRDDYVDDLSLYNCLGLNADNKFTFFIGIEWYEFEINESDDYISIIVYEKWLTNICGDDNSNGNYPIVTTYTIDKNTGREVSKEELLDIYNLDSKDLPKKFQRVFNDYENFGNEFISFVEDGNYFLWLDKNNSLYASFQYPLDIETLKLENDEWIYYN